MRMCLRTRALALSFVLFALPAWAQHEGHAAPSAPGATVNQQQIAACVQSQQQVMTLVDAGNRRLEMARQTNDPVALRTAMDDFQATLSAVKTQLASCVELAATIPATDPHAGHVMPNAQQAPAATPGTPATQRGSTQAPRALTPVPPTPGSVDSHAGHSPAAAPARSAGPASAARRQPPAPAQPLPSAAPRTPAASAGATDPHAGHAMPTAPAVSAPAGAAGSRAAESANLLPAPPTDIATLKCRAQVDPKTALRMLYQGRMYYFCSEQERAAFAKDPKKYAIPAGQAAPTHKH